MARRGPDGRQRDCTAACDWRRRAGTNNSGKTNNSVVSLLCGSLKKMENEGGEKMEGKRPGVVSAWLPLLFLQHFFNYGEQTLLIGADAF